MTKTPLLLTVISRTILFTLLWWVITEGAYNSWYLGIPVIMLSVLTSVYLSAPVSLSLKGILRFIPFFLWHSLRGGIDVAKKAIQPKLSMTPELIEYPWKLPTKTSQVFMASVVSLLPGSLSIELSADTLQIHVLEATDELNNELVIIEQRVAELFGIKVSSKGTAS